MDSQQLQSLVNPATINDIKPRLLEAKIAESDKFFNLSDGFQKIFANDKKDQKLVIPICGYGGHRRGDRSQNYFGKSFRDITIQSKRLERSLNPKTRKNWSYTKDLWKKLRAQNYIGWFKSYKINITIYTLYLN